jgi:hypothetical protein
MPEPYMKKDGKLIQMHFGVCSLLKSKMHKGYSKLYVTSKNHDEKTGNRSYEMFPVYDKDGNEILVKYAHDCLVVYINDQYCGNGKRKYELEIQTDYGVE